MKRIRNFLEDESGVMVSTEALFLYPFTIFIIFWLIYMGLWMFQGVAIQNYAQKLAVTAAREVSYPGYTNLAQKKGSDGKYYGNALSVFGTHAIDWDTTNGVSIYINPTTKDLKISPYRYLTSIGKNSNILGDKKVQLESIGQKIVKENSLLSGTDIRVSIQTDNYFISQQVTVKITESLPVPGIVKWLGFDGSSLSATASATANDPDEYVRNTDLVFDFLDILGKKLGISDGISGAIEKVKSVIEDINKIGL